MASMSSTANATNARELHFHPPTQTLIQPTSIHDTHVAGLVGATQNNGIGITGIAPGVKLMILRVMMSVMAR